MDGLPDKLATGIIRRSHGVKGFLRVKSLSGETGHFTGLKSVVIRIKNEDIRYFVEAVKKFSSGEILIKFQGIDTPEAGKKLIGKLLWVEREKAAPLGKNEFYIADLCRCGVYQKKHLLGRVVSVAEGGKAQLLEVRDEKGKTFLIPFEKRFVKEIDIGNRKIILSEDYP